MDVSILLKSLSFLHQLACQLPLPLDEMLEVPAVTATRGRGSDTRCHTCLCVCHMIWTRCIVMDCCLGIVRELECTGKRRYCLRRKHDLHVTSVVWTHSASFMHQSTLSAPLTLIMLWKIRPLFWMFLSIQSVLWPAGCLGVSCLLFQWHLWKGAFDSFHPLTYI